MNAKTIVHLLADKHSKDVFVPECKDGPTQGGPHMRLDAWAMRRSWVNPCAFGYEIKVSRQDFVGDDKWMAYLNLCNQFYFISPSGIIQPNEIPKDAGLLVVSKTGSRLFTKKKAPYRDVALPAELYQYVLMARCKIVGPYENADGSREYWQRWMDQKEQDLRFGHLVGKRLRELIAKKIDEVDVENKRLQSRIKQLEEVQVLLQKLGIDSDSIHMYGMCQRLERVKRIVPHSLLSSLDRTTAELEGLKRRCEALAAEGGTNPNGKGEL